MSRTERDTKKIDSISGKTFDMFDERIGSPKPILAVTALCIFGVVACLTKKQSIRTVAQVVMLNAALCHIKGYLNWDVYCNFALATCFLLTDERVRKEALPLCLPLLGVFLANHFVFDSFLVHAVVVQGTGGYMLLRSEGL